MCQTELLIVKIFSERPNECRTEMVSLAKRVVVHKYITTCPVGSHEFYMAYMLKNTYTFKMFRNAKKIDSDTRKMVISFCSYCLLLVD